MSIQFKHYDPRDLPKLASMIKISAHTIITNPETMGYPYLESIRSFANLCDEVIVVDGGTTDGSLEKIMEIDKVTIIKGEKWERDFDWKIIGKNLNIGYKKCQYKWAFHFDTDYIFHEDDVQPLKEKLAIVHLPALELLKINFVFVNEFFKKMHYPLLVNKGDFPAICYGIGLDNNDDESATFLRPIARNHTRKDGMEVGDIIKMDNIRVERCNIPIYTYDFTFMTKAQVAEQRERFANAVLRFRNKKEIISKQDAFYSFVNLMQTRHTKCQTEGKVKIQLKEHSKFIREKVKNITPEQFGHSGWKPL